MDLFLFLQGSRVQHERSARPWHLLMWSARSMAALDAVSEKLANHLKTHPHIDLGDVAHTLQVGRKPFKHRRMGVWRDSRDAANALSDRSFQTIASGEAEPGDRPVLFMFPGQGAQHPNMALDLYRHERVFREHGERHFRELPAVFEGAELVVAAGTQMAAASIADAVGAEYRYVAYYPALFLTAEAPPAFVPSQRWPRWALWRRAR